MERLHSIHYSKQWKKVWTKSSNLAKRLLSSKYETEEAGDKFQSKNFFPAITRKIKCKKEGRLRPNGTSIHPCCVWIQTLGSRTHKVWSKMRRELFMLCKTSLEVCNHKLHLIILSIEAIKRNNFSMNFFSEFGS